MRLRTQLVLAAFVLAVVPLAAIVVYSYQTSRDALEAAYHREAAASTRQMDRRLTAIRAELEEGLTAASTLPSRPAETKSDSASLDIDSIARQISDSAALVEALECPPPPPPPAPPMPILRVDARGMREPIIIDILHFKVSETQKNIS